MSEMGKATPLLTEGDLLELLLKIIQSTHFDDIFNKKSFDIYLSLMNQLMENNQSLKDQFINQKGLKFLLSIKTKEHQLW